MFVGDTIVMNQELFALAQQDLAALEAELLSVVDSPVDLVHKISDHLVQAGGKRLRPALYFLCARSSGGQPATMMPLATAIEMIHMATLVHDDVVDSSNTRRGRPTANSLWGNQMSVLTGDYLFAKAFALIATQVNQNMLRVLADVICAMCEGEIIQNQFIFQLEQSEQEYYARIAKKTADFIAASCELGALSAGLTAEATNALRQYGYALGMAFQITDDILDVTASSVQIGKPAGNDLRQGIITLPVLRALTVAEERDSLRSLLEQKVVLNDEEVRQALDIVHASDGVAYAYAKVDGYLQQAKEVLPDCLKENFRETFCQVADFVNLRKC